MGFFSRKTAEALDNTAAAIVNAAGDKVGEKIVNAVIAPVRTQFDHDCTRCATGKCDRA